MHTHSLIDIEILLLIDKRGGIRGMHLAAHAHAHAHAPGIAAEVKGAAAAPLLP